MKDFLDPPTSELGAAYGGMTSSRLMFTLAGEDPPWRMKEVFESSGPGYLNILE